MGKLSKLMKYGPGGTLPLSSTPVMQRSTIPIPKKPLRKFDNNIEPAPLSRDLRVKLSGNPRLDYTESDLLTKADSVNRFDQKLENSYNLGKKNVVVKDNRYNMRNNQKVNSNVLDDIVKASVKSGVDPYTSLAVAQRESGIGTIGSGNLLNPKNIFSNWYQNDVEHNYIDAALSKSPISNSSTLIRPVKANSMDIVDKFVKNTTSYPFQSEMNTIKDKTKNGTFIRGYNYGDPDYGNKVNKEKDILMAPENEPFRNYVDSVTNVAQNEMKTAAPKRTVAQAMKTKKMALGGYGDYSQPETYENLLAAGIIPKGTQLGNSPLLASAKGIGSNSIAEPALSSATTQIPQTTIPAKIPSTGSGVSAGAVAGAAGVLGNVIEGTSTPDAYGVRSGGAAIGGGALKGAATGAAIGSVIPGVGTVVGGAVGAVAGGIGGLVGNNKAKARRNIAQTKMGILQRQQQMQDSEAAIAANPDRVTGNMNASYYAMGGTMKGTLPGKPRLRKAMAKVQPAQDLMPNIASVPGRQISRMAVGGDMTKADFPYWMGANGGSLEKLSSDDTKVTGNSHAAGGVKFPSAGVELEGGETVNNNFVFSKKLGFAQQQEKIARATGKVEKQPDTVINKTTIAALQRQTQGLKMAQEATKAKMGIPNDLEQKAMGGPIGGPGDVPPVKKASVPDPTKAPAYNASLLTNGKFLVSKPDGTVGQWGNDPNTVQPMPAIPAVPTIPISNKAMGTDNNYTTARDHRNLAKDVPTIKPSYRYKMGGKLKMAMGGTAGDPRFPLPDRSAAPAYGDYDSSLNMEANDYPIVGQRVPKIPTPALGVATTPAAQPLSSNKKGVDWNGAVSAVTPFISNVSNALTKLPLPPMPILDSGVSPVTVDYSASRAEAVRGNRGANKSNEQGLSSSAAVAATRAANLAQQQRSVGQINEAEQNTNATLRGQAQQTNAVIRSSNNAKMSDYNNSLVERTLKGQQLKSENLANVENKIQGMARDKKMFDLEDQKVMLEALKDDTGASYRGAKAIFAKHLSSDSINELDKHFTQLEADAKTDRENNTKQNKLQLAMAKKKAEDSNLSVADILGNASTVTTAKEDNANRKKR